MGLLAELGRRNVFRVGAAYVVLGWVVIQVTDIAVPALRLPDWVPSLVFYLGIIGFPFALLFAWAFELTPDGIKLEKDVDRSHSVTAVTGRKLDFIIIGLLLVAVVFLVLDKYTLQREVATPSPSVPVEAEALQEQGYDSIAVLPFVNMSDDPEQDYLSDGLAEELLNSLAQVRSLKVAARTSTFAFKGQNADIRQVGETLGVATVLEGSVRKSGARLRITAQLIDVDSGYHLWSDTYDRELSDIFDIQDDIAGKIIQALKVHLDLDTPTQVTTTTDAQAYQAYLKGRQGLHQRTIESIETAKGLFETATARDPDFALAWAGQALAVNLLSARQYGEIPAEQAIVRSAALADRALALEPDLPEGLAVKALLLMDDFRYQEAITYFDRALEQRPGYAEALLWRAMSLADMGQTREAQLGFQRASELDPLHPAVRANHTRYLCKPGGEAMSAQAWEAVSKNSRGTVYCHLQRGEYAQALTLADDSGIQDWGIRRPIKDCDAPIYRPARDMYRVMQLASCYRDQEALATYATLPPGQQQEQQVQEWMAITYLRRGETEKALEALISAHEGRVPIAGRIPAGFITSNASLALDRVLALRELGRTAEADKTLARVREYVNTLKEQGRPDGYYLLEAKLLLLEGRQADALPLIDKAYRAFEVSWITRHDPVLLATIGLEHITQMTAWLDKHIDAEREKMGLPPAGF